MYAQWLYFFNSPLKEISIKGKKQKQIVIKEWLDDGSMKISGNKPSKWSITIQTILSTDIPTLQHMIQNDKIKATYLFQRAFKDRNKKLFNEGEQLYSISEKNKKDLILLLDDNDSILKNIQEQVFKIKRKIYLINLEKPIDSNKDKKLTLELKVALLNQMNTLKGIEEREKNYILRPQSILRSGPTPDPPGAKDLSIKIISKKSIGDIEYVKDVEDVEDIKDVEDIEDVEEVEAVEALKPIYIKNVENMKGGYIKVIKL
jgi:hypothetical protein